MLRSNRFSRVLVPALAGLFVLAVLPIEVLAAPYAATASLSPTVVSQGVPTTFTLTVTNTGTTTSIGAIEVRRPDNRWLMTSCLTSPAGWSVMTSSDTMCRYKSGSGTADDIQPNGGAGQFTFSATAVAPTTSGTFKVTVSNLNTFAKPARLRVIGGALTVTVNADAAPSVTSTSPADGATDVALNATIVINFSEDVSAPISAFTLECPAGTPVAFSGAGATTSSVSFTADSDLPAGVVCTVSVLAASISDSDTADPPDHPTANYVFSFTTADTAPSVTSTSPADGTTTNVAPNASIVVTFSEPVNATQFSFALKCPPFSPNQPFGVTGSPGSSITIDPIADLPEGTVCAVKVIASQIHDTDAVDPPDTMVADYNFSFTTGTGQAPTDMQLSPDSINQNQPIGTDVGTLTTTDADAGDSNVYTLENTGCGGGPFADNSSFQIGGLAGDVLQSAAVFDYATKSSYTVCIRATDSGTLSFDKQFTITINPPNTAPVLNDTKTPVVAAEDEDAPTPVGVVGTPVSGLVDLTTPAGGLDNVTDPDAGAIAGIAVTADQTFIPVSGTWYYTTDGGTNWTAFPSISASTALLLAADANTRVYFKPAANFNGTLATGLTFHAWDQTSGTNGGTADTSTNGGSTAFSTATDTASITINAINDAPVAQTKTASAQANMEIVGIDADLLTGVTDADSGISGCSPTFSLASITANTGGTVSNVNLVAGTFDFDPTPGFTGAAVVNYTVSDTGCPGATTSAAAAINITVSGPVIWFVDPVNGSDTTGNGTLVEPFKTVTAVSTVDSSDEDIFVYSGSTTASITLESGEKLIGQGVIDATGFDDFFGITPPTGTVARPSINGTAPTLGGSGVVLGSGNTLNALSFSATTAAAISGSTDVGTLTLVDIAVSNTTTGGISLTGGGTVTATGTNTIATTTGTALNISNTTIGASGVTFKSIAANGATNGVVLDTTGSTGGLTITGDGSTANSGGTIQSTTGAGISLNSTKSVALSWIRIASAQHAGIKGSGVHGFSLTHSTITGFGAALTDVKDAGIAFNSNSSSPAANVDGAVTITNCTISNGYGSAIDIYNQTGTISDANISSNTLTSSTSTATSKGDAIVLNLFGTTTTVASLTKAEIDSNTITNFPSGSGIVVQGAQTSSATAPAGTYGTITGTPGTSSNIINISSNSIVGDATAKMAGAGIIASVTGRGTGSFNITNNGTVATPVKNMTGQAIGVGVAGNASADFNITNNVLAPNNALGSSGLGIGTDRNVQADLNTLASPILNATVNGNTVSLSDGYGINFLQRDDNGTAHLKLVNNTVSAPKSSPSLFSSIHVAEGSTGSASYNPTLCATISGNTAATGPDDGVGNRAPGIVLDKLTPSSTTYVFGITGLSPSPATAAQTESYVATQNPASGAGTGIFAAETVYANTTGFTSCTLPF